MNTMNTPIKPRRYNAAQKAEAIDFCLKEKLACAKAAQRLGLHPSSLSRWLRQVTLIKEKHYPLIVAC